MNNESVVIHHTHIPH